MQEEVNITITSPEFRTYLVQKYHWHYTTPDLVNWKPGGKIYNNLDRYSQCFMTRYVYQQLPVHGASHQRQDTIVCPICKNSTETFMHFIQCTHNIVILHSGS
eukprot:10825953-Ditylum_brightwellii.AAC.1